MRLHGITAPIRAAVDRYRGTIAPAQRSVMRIGSDRLIATARVIVSAVLLFVIWLDPTQPAVRWQVAYLLLVGYLGLSIIVAAVEYQHGLELPDPARLALHMADVLFITALVYFTQGITESVFGFFVYLVVVSHVRWQWRGTLATSALVLLGYFLVMMISPNMPVAGDEGTTNLEAIIVRLCYLSIVATILAYIGYAQENATEKMLVAAEWPTVMDPSDALPKFLAHAAKVLGTDGVALLWLAEREAAADLVFWADERLIRRSWPRDLVEARLYCQQAQELFHWRGRAAPIVVISGRRKQLTRTPPLPHRLLRLCGGHAVLGIWFHARSGYGCLLSRRALLEPDDVVLAQIIADRFRAWADQAELYRQVEEGRLREQQFSLARDLHDTVLQTLAGGSLQLQSIAPQIAMSYPALSDRIDRLVQTLTREQEDLRNRLRELASDVRKEHANAPVPLTSLFSDIAQRIERRWDLSTEYSVDPATVSVPGDLARELTHVLLEAAANARRHSGAKLLTLRASAERERLALAVTNDRGQSTTTGHARTPVSFDPKMLRNRVEHLGGWISVDADPVHVKLAITVPLGTRIDA